jgi:hypothetical protein
MMVAVCILSPQYTVLVCVSMFACFSVELNVITFVVFHASQLLHAVTPFVCDLCMCVCCGVCIGVYVVFDVRMCAPI